MAKAAGKTLFEGLLARKILVRNYSQHPLLPGALRISTGTLEENARIIEAVKEILEDDHERQYCPSPDEGN